MAVQAVQLGTTGLIPNTTGLGKNLSQQLPVPIFIQTNDTLATIVTSGYLNKSHSDFNFPYNNDQMALVSTTDQGTVWLRVVVSGSTYSLQEPTGNAVVALPTVANQIVYSTNTTGGLSGSGLATALFNAGNISAGKSGTAGVLASYPSAATSGKLQLVGVANAADYAVSISNASFGQASTLTFADVGSAAGRFLVANTATPFTSGNLPKASGTGGLMVDSGIAATSIIVSSNNAGQTIAASTSSATPGTIRSVIGSMTGTNSVMTSGNLVGVRGVVNYVGASGGFLYGTQGKLIPTGTLSGSSWNAAIFGQFDISAATINAGQTACIWGDYGATSGTISNATGMRGIAMTNTTAAVLNSQVYLFGGATNLLELDTNSGGVGTTYVTTAAGATAGGTLKKLAITIDGATFYILAAGSYS